MNGLLVGLVVWLAAAGGPLRGRGRGAVLGLVAGAGMANHLTCVLVAPIGLHGVVRAARESRPSTYAFAVLGLALGLVPYVYLLVADGPASWGTVSLDTLLATILRREYGSFRLAVGGPDVPWTASVAACLWTIARSWLWAFAIAGVAMLGVRIWRPAGESRAAWAMLAVSFLLAGPILTSQFNIDPHGMGLVIVRRFHILPTLLLTVPVAAALDLVCARVTRPRLVSALALVSFLGLLLAAAPGLARIHSPAMERGVQNLLRSLPPAAIAVVMSEDQCFGGHYLQLARGERPDVAFICSPLLLRDWYRATWTARGLAMPATAAPSLATALIATGRPVFVDGGLVGILGRFQHYPFGILYRVLPRGTAPPPPGEVAVINRELYRAFDLDYPHPGRDDGFAAVAHRRYTAAWAAIAELLDAGDPDGARDAVELARQLQPLQDE
jgi:hypothetical protein